MTDKNRKIRVAIVDDHAVVRAGLRAFLSASPDLDIVAEAASGREALAALMTTPADVALIDLAMPGMGGLELTEELGRRKGPKVIVLTMHEDALYARALLAAGARGYVLKRALDSELIDAVRTVHAGGAWVDSTLGVMPAPVALTAPALTVDAEARDAAGNLAPREREVLRLLAEGHTNREVADQLELSMKTVETYRARIVEKLHLRTRASLVRFAMNAGLLGVARP